MSSATDKPAGLLSRWHLRRQQVEAEAAAEKAVAIPLADDAGVLQYSNLIERQGHDSHDSHDKDSHDQNNYDPDNYDHRVSEATGSEANISTDGKPAVLTAADLPNPDEIEIGGSFARFMGANVDPAAKSAALKALWKQPQFNEIDGLLEYALDYTNQPLLAPEVSAELANKVFRHIIKAEEDAKAEQEALAAASDQTLDKTTISQQESSCVSTLASDNLDGECDELPQNAPEQVALVAKPVV